MQQKHICEIEYKVLFMCSVGFEAEGLRQEAERLASLFDFHVDNQKLPRLSVTPDKLVLLCQGFSPLYADFHSKTLLRRREAHKTQGLIKACRPCKGLRILDATAGWGRDAALLASFGAEVVMVERQAVMAALLTDALTRLPGSEMALSLVFTDAIGYLQSLSVTEAPDVIYIDPMHPSRKKSALVKKDMQILQELFGHDEDALALLQQARLVARQRVVVKWPQQLPPLEAPSHCIQGKTVRFDVYAQFVQKVPLLSTT